MITNLDLYEQDYIIDTTALLKHQGLPLDMDKIHFVASQRRARVAAILENGLDIGTIMRRVVPVSLVYHDAHGWVFQPLSPKLPHLYQVSRMLR